MARHDRPREPRDVTQQRIYVGVVGLAAVFLLTLLAASVFALLGQDTSRTAASAANGAAANQMAAQDTPKEPLAELGVAPGNAPKTPAGTASPASRAASPQPHR